MSSFFQLRYLNNVVLLVLLFCLVSECSDNLNTSTESTPDPSEEEVSTHNVSNHTTLADEDDFTAGRVAYGVAMACCVGLYVAGGSFMAYTTVHNQIKNANKKAR